MSEVSPPTLSEFFALLQQIESNILKLRLAVLPHPQFLMLLERAQELRQALRLSVKKAFRRRLQAAPGRAATAEQMEGLRAAVVPLFKLLRSVRRSAAADLRTAEQSIPYNRIPYELQFRKRHLRELSGKIEEGLNQLAAGVVIEKYLAELTAMAAELERLDALFLQLNRWAKQRVDIYCTSIEKIFSLLEKVDILAGARRDVTFSLRAIAYQHIAESGLFDRSFYLAQIPEEEKDLRDALKHYLSGAGSYFPSRYFNDTFYMAAHAEVRKLRYNALEHFVRYGEVMRFDPCPEFDTIHYLRSNDDILDANISPIRHFVRHGLAEGRPPSAKAVRFFAGRYLDAASLSLAFIGEPNAMERPAWEVVRLGCHAEKGRHVADIPAEDWTGGETGFAAFVIGSAGAARLDEAILRAMNQSGARLVYLGSDPQRDVLPQLEQRDLPLTRICAITPHYEGFLRWQESEAPLRLHYYPFADPDDSSAVIEALISRLASPRDFATRRFAPAENTASSRPLISVVSIIYKKAKEMQAFLESLNRQDIARPYEVVLVNDASPDDTEKQVHDWLQEKRAANLLNKHMRVRIIRNPTNSGNCVSRNRGIEAAEAEIVLVVDGDVVLSTSSLTEHLLAYRDGDCDAVIGFFGFNMDFAFVFDWLAACEIDHKIVNEAIILPKNHVTRGINMRFMQNSMFNFVTRNTSFKKSSLNGSYFDTAFSYTSAKTSGYGEEDHELGARLYFNHKKTRFLDSAISVHIRHHDSSHNDNKSIANLRNWNRLIAKFPDLPLVDRQYYQWRTSDLLGKTAPFRDSPEVREAQARFTAKDRACVRIRPSKPLNILTYKWHVPHQYELFKLNNHRFTLATNIGTEHCNHWDYNQRPKPRNVEFVPLEEIDVDAFDFAILPFDEHVLFPKYCKSLTKDWGSALLTMLEATKNLTRAAICHGSPQVFEQDDPASGHRAGEVIAASREALRELLRDVHVVCNSYQAQQEWGFAKSSVIWHGFSPVEFPPGTHEHPGCLTLGANAFTSLPLKRGRDCLERVKELIGDDRIVPTDSPSPHSELMQYGQEWGVAKFQKYVSYIGDFMIYLNPTVACPMPRSRGEAMMTGTIPVSLCNHDVNMFIKNGVNGFYSESAEEMAEQICWLLGNERERNKISRNARLLAMDLFNIDRYLASWSDLIATLTKS